MSEKTLPGDGSAPPPVEPSPPRLSRWPSAKIRQPPANAHSAGGLDPAGVGLGATVGLAAATTAGAGWVGAALGGKMMSHGLTTAAPRKIPIRKVTIGTARLTPLGPTCSKRTSSRCSSIADPSDADRAADQISPR